MAAAEDDHGPSVKDDELYEKLREEGSSKGKAAAVANAAAQTSRSKVGEKGGSRPPYQDWSKDDLVDRARELDIDGRATMTKDDLVDALRNS